MVSCLYERSCHINLATQMATNKSAMYIYKSAGGSSASNILKYYKALMLSQLANVAAGAQAPLWMWLEVYPT